MIHIGLVCESLIKEISHSFIKNGLAALHIKGMLIGESFSVLGISHLMEGQSFSDQGPKSRIKALEHQNYRK